MLFSIQSGNPICRGQPRSLQLGSKRQPTDINDSVFETQATSGPDFDEGHRGLWPVYVSLTMRPAWFCDFCRPEESSSMTDNLYACGLSEDDISQVCEE